MRHPAPVLGRVTEKEVLNAIRLGETYKANVRARKIPLNRRQHIGNELSIVRPCGLKKGMINLKGRQTFSNIFTISP